MILPRGFRQASFWRPSSRVGGCLTDSRRQNTSPLTEKRNFGEGARDWGLWAASAAGRVAGSGFRKNPTKISGATSGMRRGFELRDSGSACGI